jgi:hypothetical protein
VNTVDDAPRRRGYKPAATIPCGEDGELDEVAWLDRFWFQEHPGVAEYYREPHPVEARMHADEGLTVRRVRVTQLAPGVHSREFLLAEGGER